eukprot:CAMPEP_0118997608 /NCGR_PEP_ID=MMETSP1173-20130426/62050_1 /TAXON_ID=1034831 /ORGANISM="Rhizochromulina marina cf, Strain CCMP1243" /LENGTH=42 /DNA_ID= /DNA_START= /DNA_END= /DNA_ORIENTATION=
MSLPLPKPLPLALLGRYLQVFFGSAWSLLPYPHDQAVPQHLA